MSTAILYPESANIFLTLLTYAWESHNEISTPSVPFWQTGSNGIRRRFVVCVAGRLEILSGGEVIPVIDKAVERMTNFVFERFRLLKKAARLSFRGHQYMTSAMRGRGVNPKEDVVREVA